MASWLKFKVTPGDRLLKFDWQRLQTKNILESSITGVWAKLQL